MPMQSATVNKVANKVLDSQTSPEPEWIVEGTLSKTDEATLYEAVRIVQDREKRNTISQAKKNNVVFGKHSARRTNLVDLTYRIDSAKYKVNKSNTRAKQRRARTLPDGAVQKVDLTPCYPNDKSLVRPSSSSCPSSKEPLAVPRKSKTSNLGRIFQSFRLVQTRRRSRKRGGMLMMSR